MQVEITDKTKLNFNKLQPDKKKSLTAVVLEIKIII